MIDPLFKSKEERAEARAASAAFLRKSYPTLHECFDRAMAYLPEFDGFEWVAMPSLDCPDGASMWITLPMAIVEIHVHPNDYGSYDELAKVVREQIGWAALNAERAIAEFEGKPITVN